MLFILAHLEFVYNYFVLKFGYLAMILFTIAGSFWLEVVLKIGVLRRLKRLALSILPVSVFFIAWDAYAISQGHWFFDEKQILGIMGPFEIPFTTVSISRWKLAGQPSRPIGLVTHWNWPMPGTVKAV